MVQKDEYQDPILTPGNLRQFVENLPGKAKHHHESYNYDSNPTNFYDEINEFFKYTEVAVQLQDYRRSFEKEFGEYHPQQIISLLDQLELTDQEKRLKSCQHLTYIALGCFTAQPHESKYQRIKQLVRNNQGLINSGAFFIVLQKLQQSCIEYDKLLNSNNSNTTIVGTTAEINLYLTLLYLILETQRIQVSSPSDSFKQELVSMKPNLAEFFFTLLAKLQGKQEKSFPMKKVALLLWKSLLFMSGGFETIKSNAKLLEQSLGLENNKKAIITKCTPQDMLIFQTEITDKYPGYQPPKLPFHVTSPLTIQASLPLAAAMSYANATNQVELLYQTLFPPKATTTTTVAKKPQHPLLQNFETIKDSPALALPLTYEGSHVPKSVEEAGQVYLDNLHVSLANYQLIEERSRVLHRWQHQHQKQQEDIAKEKSLLERIYAKLLPDLKNVILLLLKSLLMAVSPVPLNKNEEKEKERITLEYLEEADGIRDQEVISKAISGILLVLLKWTKSSHVLQFEHVSQLLADSGCLLIILKIVGLHELTDLVQARTNVPYYSFFDYSIHRKASNLENEDAHQDYTNHRNMFWAINHLRILQMLTKNKPHRIMLLVQYKSAAILKRILKIAHPVLERYILKLLKSQVPYLGRKWRSKNMKIISAIYLHCKTGLRDDWISKLNADQDVEEGKIQEKHLRILISLYHCDSYGMASCLPLHDEVNTKNGCIPTGPGFNGYCTYDLDQIEPGFETMTDMDQTWLDQIVDMDEIDDLDRPAPVDTPAPSTPYPCTDKGFSPDQLAYEISKLYIQEMNSEFNPIPPLTNTEKEPDDTAWQSPPLPKKLTPLTRYTGGEHNMTYLRPAVEETTMQVDDEEWQVRVYDELLARLTHVQDKTTEKWLGRIDYDDGPYRFKVFEYFDQDFWSASSSSLSSASDYPCLEGEKQQQQQQRHISFEEDAEENVLL